MHTVYVVSAIPDAALTLMCMRISVNIGPHMMLVYGTERVRASLKHAMLRMYTLLCCVCTQALRSSGGPYFLGEQFSMVDIMFTPFLERMAASLPYYKV
jgi:glutathione S-transferase